MPFVSAAATCILFLVHTVICLIRSFQTVYCFLVRILFSKSLNSQEISRKFRGLSQKKPNKVAIILDDRESLDLENLVQLFYWLALARVEHVAVYDVTGFVKRSHRKLEKLLENCNFEEDVIFQVKPSLLLDGPENFLSLPEKNSDSRSFYVGKEPLSFGKSYPGKTKSSNLSTCDFPRENGSIKKICSEKEIVDKKNIFLNGGMRKNLRKRLESDLHIGNGIKKSEPHGKGQKEPFLENNSEIRQNYFSGFLITIDLLSVRDGKEAMAMAASEIAKNAVTDFFYHNSISSNGNSVSCDGKSFSLDGNSVFCDGKSVSCNGKSVFFDRKPVPFDGNTGFCNGKSLSLESKSVYNGESVVCNGKQKIGQMDEGEERERGEGGEKQDAKGGKKGDGKERRRKNHKKEDYEGDWEGEERGEEDKGGRKSREGGGGEEVRLIRRREKLTEADVESAMETVGAYCMEPDLILVFGKTFCLGGFPPWTTRLSEILYVGSLKNFHYLKIFEVLEHYAKTEQRLGK